MIDEDCAIWKKNRKKGFCWVPSAAWGLTDPEVCARCQLKNRTCRYCGLRAEEIIDCQREECRTSKVVPLKLVG